MILKIENNLDIYSILSRLHINSIFNIFKKINLSQTEEFHIKEMWFI